MKKFDPADYRTWHGHVKRRPDGVSTRCGGTKFGCSSCLTESAHWFHANLKGLLGQQTQRQPASYADVQAAARQSAFHPLSGKALPSQAQALAGNYAVGRLKLAGLPVCIETPYGTERSGTDADGTPWCNTMAAHYGYIAGTRGADGDPVDIFIGPAPEQMRRVWVLNQTHADGSFDEHKVLFGFTGADQALNAYRASYVTGWKRYGPPLELSLAQLHWWLRWADKRLPISHDLLPAQEPENTAMDPVDTTVPRPIWLANGVPASESIGDVWAGLSRHDGTARLLLDAVSMADLTELGVGQPKVALDAIVTEAGRLKPRMDSLMHVMEAVADEKVKPLAYQISEPLKRHGGLHIAVLFELADGQTVTIWFHNPDSTPAKISPVDELVSWKWMLNKKDITLTVAPEAGADLDVREVARRVMALSLKNSPAFARANTNRTERMQRIEGMREELGAKQAFLKDLNGQIEVAQEAKRMLANADPQPAPQPAPVQVGADVAAPASLSQGQAALRSIRQFLSAQQFKTISALMKGEEGAFFIDKAVELAQVIASMPVTYGQDDKGDEAVVYLHYFQGSADHYITEKDVNGGVQQAFGLADLFGDGGELGYINISELTDAGAELDLHWEPKTLRAIRGGSDAPNGNETPVSAARSGTQQEQAVADASLDMASGVVAILGGSFEADGFSAPGTSGAWSYGKAVVNGKDVYLAASGGGVVQVNNKPHDPQGKIITTAEQVRAAIWAVAPYPEENQPGRDLSPEGRENIVKTAKGNKVATGFAVVEAASLIVSHDADGNANPDYPMELQPRDRARATSQTWVKKTAQNLDPESLGRTTRTDTGAPIVGKDRVVESGNGRTMAIIEAYRIGKADEYRAWLEEEAAYFGINPDKVRAMKRPVLVRVRTSEVDRRAFAVEANQDDKLGMTATEKARADAKRLDSALLSYLPADGDLTATGARDFLAGFLKSLGDAEAAQYITSDGKPTASLIARVQAAIFAKAYADDRLLELTADSAKPEIANIVSALNAAAPDFVRAMDVDSRATEDATQALTDGIELSLNQQAVAAIIGATNVVKLARDSGMQVEEFVKQQGLFGDVDPAVAAVAVFIAKNNRSAKRLGSAFKAMAQFIGSELQRRQTVDMFGAGTAQVSMADVVAAANRQLEKEYGEGSFSIEQFGLFGAQHAASESPLTPLPDDPHMVSFEVFLAHARAKKLENHARKWDVEYTLPNGVSDHGFSDASTAEEAARDIHRSLVNNAIFANTPDQKAAAFEFNIQKTVDMPPKSVLAEYPDLVENFPDVFGKTDGTQPVPDPAAALPRVSDTEILSAYRKIIRASNGVRSFVEIGELHKSVGGSLSDLQSSLRRMTSEGKLADAYFVRGDPVFLSPENKEAGVEIGGVTYYGVELPMSDAPARPASSKPPENPQRATALATLNQIASGQHPDMLSPDLYGVVEEALNAYPGDAEIEAAATAAVDAMEAGNLSATAKF